MASNKVLTILAGSALAIALGGPTEAATITWNTCGNMTTGSSRYVCDNGLTGSTRTGGGATSITFIAVGGQELVTDAWQVASPASSYPFNSIYQGGLGAGNESNPQHAVDNTNNSNSPPGQAGNEFIIFEFPEDGYVPLSFTLGWIETDGDTQTWIGGSDALNNLFTLLTTNSEGYDWGTQGGGVGGVDTPLTSLGYTYQAFDATNANEPQTFSFTNGASGRYLIVAAPTGFDEDDRFKISQMVANTPNGVPEPGTLVLLGAGLAVLAFRRTR